MISNVWKYVSMYRILILSEIKHTQYVWDGLCMQ